MKVSIAIIIWFCISYQNLAAQIPMPEWISGASIYEVNLRQMTPEGNIQAFRKHLPRLKEMGISVIWFMPIHPISFLKRKGSLGSYYSVADYKLVNYEFGRSGDFKKLIEEIHALDMKVIIDWVGNHTGWDHEWIKLHPEWYTKKEDTITHVENTDWHDVADLNFDVKAMRIEMVKSMMHWIEVYKIDGFRCDVAMMVPNAFWSQFNKSCIATKNHVFMLAEAEEPSHRNDGLFHADYAWTLQQLLLDLYKGTKTKTDFINYLEEDRKRFSKGFHMHFTSNHDENSWNGTEFDRYGDAHKAFATLSFTLRGIPLIYCGQEEPFNIRIRFFDKDTIVFEKYAYAEFYKKLIYLKKNNSALASDSLSALEELIHIPHNHAFAFVRNRDKSSVVCMYNFSGKPIEFEWPENKNAGSYIDLDTDKKVKLRKGQLIKLIPWSYKIYHR